MGHDAAGAQKATAEWTFLRAWPDFETIALPSRAGLANGPIA